ncbi:MAG: hypothetical protein RL458_3336 [Pseudomonadota bacterium]|jgi:hypothetical protein
MIGPDDALRPSRVTCAQAEQPRKLCPPGGLSRSLGERIKPGGHPLEAKQQGAP